MNRRDEPIENIPADVRLQATEEIIPYVVNLLSVTRSGAQSTEKVSQIGSGTLVMVEGQHFILTAEHVITKTGFLECDELGLVVKQTSHRLTIPRSKLQVAFKVVGTDPSTGPDLGAIWISGDSIGALASAKLFWPLQKYKDIALTHIAVHDMGFWTVSGFPQENAKIVPGPDANAGELRAGGIVAYSLVRPVAGDGQHDYLDLLVDYNSAKGVPRTFQSVSGGGLWHVILAYDKDGAITYRPPVLSGVAFYQSEVQDGERYIRCHGVESVYRVALELFLEFVRG